MAKRAKERQRTEHGQKFGEFTLWEEIGRGGIGRVFLATARRPSGEERLLAIKRLLPAYNTDRDLIAMMMDEARLAVHLNHRNIANIFDFGYIDDQHYLALEYVSGCDLATLVRGSRGSQVRGRPLPLPTALFVMAEVAEALSYAHGCVDSRGQALNIIHRDLSPHNILLSRTGDIKVSDFGLARATVCEHTSYAGVIRGKFAYMPREQALGEAIDHRVDLFAAGATLYESITGMKPYTAHNLAQQLYQLEQPIPPPSTHVPNIPKIIDRIVMEALAPDAENRYQNADELLRDLRAALTTISDLTQERARLASLVQSVSKPPPIMSEGLQTLLPSETARESLTLGASLIADEETWVAEKTTQAKRTTTPKRASKKIPTSHSEPVSTVSSDLNDYSEADLRALDASYSHALNTGHDIRKVKQETIHSRARSAPHPDDRVDAKAKRRIHHKEREPARKRKPRHFDDPVERREADRSFRTDRSDRSSRDHSESLRGKSVRGLAKAVKDAARQGDILPRGAVRSEAFRRSSGKPRRRPFGRSAAEDEYERQTVLVQQRGNTPLIVSLALTGIAVFGVGLAAGWVLHGWLGTQQHNGRRPSTAVKPVEQKEEKPAHEAEPANIDPDRRSARAQDRATDRKRVRRTPHAKTKASSSRARRKVERARRERRLRARGRRGASKGGNLVSITSNRPGQVLIDNKVVGKTPLKIGLKTGVHRIQLIYADGTSSTTQWVDIDAARAKSIAF